MSPPDVASSFDFADILTLDRVRDGVFRAHKHLINHADGIFGGSFLAQALCAAELTAPERVPHSMNAFFLQAGSGHEAVDYHVDATRDGGSFSIRHIKGQQSGQSVFEAMVSFHKTEGGFEHAQSWSERPPHPHDVPTIQEIADRWADRVPSIERGIIARFSRGMETRIINAENFLLRKSEPRGKIWVRPIHHNHQPVSGHASIAFVSDYLMPAASILPYVNSVYSSDILSLSLSHAIWFHAPAPADAWMYHEFESPWAGAGRSLCQGRIYSEDGQLLATSTQEQLVRRRHQ